MKKTCSLFQLGTMFLGFLLAGSIVSAQISLGFDTEGPDGHTNVVDDDSNVAASGTVDFFPNPSFYDLVVNISNDSYGPDIGTAVLTGFYILSPWTSDGGPPSSSDAGDDLAGFHLATDGLNPSDWSDDTGFNNVLNEFNWDSGNGNTWEYLYFGPTTGSGSVGLDIGESATFNFNLDDNSIGEGDINWVSYFNSDIPQIFLRWQTVENAAGSEVFGGSAKGYTYFTGGTIITVPEPREIAVMAMIGLGGVLWMRKRFMIKPRKG